MLKRNQHQLDLLGNLVGLFKRTIYRYFCVPYELRAEIQQRKRGNP
jgi:hypothetical protein